MIIDDGSFPPAVLPSSAMVTDGMTRPGRAVVVLKRLARSGLMAVIFTIVGALIPIPLFPLLFPGLVTGGIYGFKEQFHQIAHRFHCSFSRSVVL